MAAIHQLISQVPDPALRERLQQEADALTHGRSFGLVFERHPRKEVDTSLRVSAERAAKK